MTQPTTHLTHAAKAYHLFPSLAPPYSTNSMENTISDIQSWFIFQNQNSKTQISLLRTQFILNGHRYRIEMMLSLIYDN